MSLIFERLSGQPCINVLERMRHEAVDLLHDELFAESLKTLATVDRRVFKEQSHCGAIWYGRKRGWQDAGNFKYAVLFQLVARMAKPTHPLHALGQKYESLQLYHDLTCSAINLQGDVIEYVLADCYETGPAVPPDIRHCRLALREKIKRFMERFDDLHRILAYDGPVAFTRWPTPSVVATWVHHLEALCIAVHRNPPSSAGALVVNPHV